MIVAVLIAGLLVGPTLHAPLEVDEHVSYWICSDSSPGDLLTRSFRYSATPPFSFLLQRWSIGLWGDSEWPLRIPSLGCFAVSIVVVAMLAARLGGVGASWIASLLVAVHPLVIKHAVVARPYGVGMLLAALAAWLTVLLARRRSLTLWVAWLATNLLLAQTHYLFCVVWLGEFAWIALSGSEWKPLDWIKVFGTWALCAVSVLPGLIKIWNDKSGLNWKTSTSSWTDWLDWTFAAHWFRLEIVFAVIASCIWLLQCWWLDEQHKLRLRAGLKLLVCFFLLPAAVFWVGGRVLEPSLSADRYVVFVVPLFLAGVGVMLGQVRVWAGPLILIGVIGWSQGTLVRVEKSFTLFRQWAAGGVAADQISQPGDLAWKEAARLVSTQNSQRVRLVLVGSGLIEMGLVARYGDDPVFHDYVSCRLGRIYLENDLEAARIALPMLWSGNTREYYRNLVERSYGATAAARMGQEIWVVCAVDTDLLASSFQQVDQLLTRLGGELLFSKDLGTVRLVRYRFA